MIAVALVVLRQGFRFDVMSGPMGDHGLYNTSAAAAIDGTGRRWFNPRKLCMLCMALVIVSCVLAPFSPNFVFVCVAPARSWRWGLRLRTQTQSS